MEISEILLEKGFAYFLFLMTIFFVAGEFNILEDCCLQ